MPDKPAPKIKIDEHFIAAVRDKLVAVREQVSVIRGGVNPNDPAHPRGMPLAEVRVITGADSFESGALHKQRALTVGGQIDKKLETIDLELDKLRQNLEAILASADHIELNNMSLADYGKFMGQGGGLPNPAPPAAS